MSPSAPLPSVVLITVDCLRRDRLSAYGYERPTTPFLDSLLDGALHATSAHSVSSWTCPAVCSLLTGLYPHRHGGGLVAGEPRNLSKESLPSRLPAEVPTLADRLGARGYASAAFGAVWNAHLPIPGRFEQMAMLEKPATKLVARSLDWIAGRSGPFFLWVHLGDTHEPLDVAPDLRGVFGPVPRLRRLRKWDYTKRTDPVGSPEFERYRDARVRLYDAATRSVDRSLEAFLARLGELRPEGDTLVVITADHGEEFWEHRAEELAEFADPRDVFGTGHGHHLFQVHLLVPLIVLGPGVPAGPVGENVSLVDVAPTILQAVGEDPSGMDGSSLLEPLPPHRPVLAEAIAYGFEKQAVVVDDRKLLSAPGDHVERLYALGEDRREVGVVEEPDTASRLRELLPGTEGVRGQETEASEEIVQHLRDLGYIE